jgi:peptidoglycan/LPS O-acetylase OafA/YrhL
MNAVNPLLSVFPMLAALITVFLISKVIRVNVNTHSRFQSIDGLRGYLALFVFFHHGMMWYYYLRLGKWQVPPSNLYTNYGQVGVALFFMITGFLFSLKLFDAIEKGDKIDWGRLFVSRFLRLVPLYFFVVAVLIFIVLFVSNFHLAVSFLSFLSQLFHWFGFTIFGNPDINAVKSTSLIVAGVFWSLPYEWLFYLALPLLAVIVGTTVPRKFIILSIFSILVIVQFAFKPVLIHIYYFIMGIIAAYCVGNQYLVRYANKKYTSFILCVLLISAFFLISTAYSKITLLISLIFFLAITNGNTLFGILTSKISMLLGEMGYSLYLLHGLILFITFKFLLGSEFASSFSPLGHWLVLSVCASVLVVCAYTTYRLIEFPAMQKVSYLHNLLRIRL